MTVFFNSTFHSVPEGESQVLVLKADKPFEVSFIVIVTLVDSTAVGKWMDEMIVNGYCETSLIDGWLSLNTNSLANFSCNRVH